MGRSVRLAVHGRGRDRRPDGQAEAVAPLLVPVPPGGRSQDPRRLERLQGVPQNGGRGGPHGRAVVRRVRGADDQGAPGRLPRGGGPHRVDESNRGPLQFLHADRAAELRPVAPGGPEVSITAAPPGRQGPGHSASIAVERPVRRPRTGIQHALVFALYLGLWLVAMGPKILPHLSQWSLSSYRNETSVFVWSLAWWAHPFAHGANPL